MGFYTGNMFPAAYRNDAFVALHGSWKQSVATGYKIVRIIASSGRATDRISAGQ
jgi:glucose/arabinose dehydrogenase